MIISKVLDGLLKGLLFLSSFAGFGIVAVVLLSVFQRYMLKSPLSFSEELIGLLLSSMLFMSLPYISNTEKHVKITLISNLLQIKYKIWLTIIAYLINLIFSAWMLIETIEWMEFAIKLNLKTEIIQKNIFEEKKLETGTIMSRAFKPMPVVLDLVNENFSNFSNIIFFMGKSGREIFQNTLKDWDLDYSEKKSLTSDESFLVNVKKIKKKIKKN